MVHGVRIDYLSPTLYFTDLIIATIWVFSKFKVRVPLSIIIFLTLNIFFSQSPFVSIYRWLRFYEYYWLFKYLVKKDLSLVSCCLSLSVIWVSILTWWQFIAQSSIGGLWYFLGERNFDITTIGIARTLTPIGLMLRPYAVFPHPNALAAFLLLMALVFKKGKVFWLAMLTIPLTLSRTGIILAVVLLIVRFMKNRILALSLSLVTCYLLLVYIPGSPDSWTQRLDLLKVGFETIMKYPLWGVGLGNFVAITSAYHFQPVHNVFVLAAAELGLPLFLVLGYLLKITRLHSADADSICGQENCKLKIAFAVLLITANVDHYWWTLPQMQLLLTIFLAVAVQLNHGGIRGIYRWRISGKPGPGGLRVRGQKLKQ